MKKSITNKQYLKGIYLLFKNKVVDTSILTLCPKTAVYMNYDMSGSGCYCYPTKPGCARITLGAEFYNRYLKLPSSITPAYVSTEGHKYIKLLKGTFYHELAHILFTPLTSKSISEYKDERYRGALHNLFNILEDIFIERYAMSIVYPFTKKYFDFMESLVFDPSEFKDYEDKGDGPSFLNFLLVKLRIGKKIKITNEFFDANKTEVLAWVDKFLSTKKPTPRIEVVVEFFEWLLSKGLEFPMMEPPATTTTGKDGEATAEEAPAEGPGSGKGGAPSEHKETDPREFSEEGSGEAKDIDDTVIEADDTLEPTSELDTPISDKDTDDYLTDTVGSADYSHNFIIVRDHFTYNKSTLEALEKLIDSVAPLSTACATKINVFKSRTRPRYVQGYPSGRLHVPSAIKGIPVNIFERKEDQGLQSDLAISLLLDNSGSMCGSRSEVCTRAAIALTVAACKAGIPIEVNAFTADGDYTGCTCYTYRMKRFQDTWDMCKPYMGITSYDVNETYSKRITGRELPTFAGNTDEINVFNVWKEFKCQKYADKLLIVISDGATCGSVANLTSVIKSVEESGIHVIGIGAESNAVSRSYTNYKVFNSISELSQLPAYFGDILLEFSKKKKR